MDEAKAHIERARNAYESYRILSGKRLFEDAFSRGYYALLHLGFAYLLNHGETLPKTHAGLVARLWAVKEKTGMDSGLVKTISRFQAIRESGDYSAVPAVQMSDLKDLDNVIIKFFKILGEKP